MVKYFTCWNQLKINRSNYEILQILSASLLDKIPINELLIKSDYNNVMNIILISWLLAYFKWILMKKTINIEDEFFGEMIFSEFWIC